ncbi:MAG: LacI family transcriptional regulator [Chloroflexota bacterium]|nr:LacI family transcriptional regulator [Chloroflexota bacterium]
MSSVSIHDVAEAAGVSTATVSYVLNDSRPVTDATRARVLEAVEELGYRPNVTARSLQAKRSFLIGYSWRPLPPKNHSPILDRFIHSMGLAAYRAGYHLLAFPAPSEEAQVDVYRDLVATNRVDGIILSATDIEDPRVEYLATTNIPFVAFGRCGDRDICPWVDVDGRAGVQRAVEHLAEQGHFRIGMLAWPQGSQSGEDRYQGYYSGLQQLALPARQEWVVRVNHDTAEGYEGMKQLLSLPSSERPTAVVCVSDLIALGAMNAIREAGLRVGADFGVVGFDNMPLAAHLAPPLSSLHQPIDQVGVLVIDQLTSLIEGEQLGKERAQILLEPKLVVRASSLRSV